MAYEGLIPIEINEQVEGATTPVTITSVTVGGLVDDGDHYYKMAYDFGGGVISSLSAVSLVATAGAGNNTVNLDDLPIGPINTVNRLLYRTKAGFADYYLVDTIADNVTTSYIDIKADGALGALFVPTFKNGLSETADGDILIQSGAKILFSTSTVSQISFDDWFNQPLKTTSSPTFVGATIIDSNFSTWFTGIPTSTSGTYNLAVGSYALSGNTVGTTNIAVGAYSLFKNTEGIQNIALGYGALGKNITGSFNVAVGVSSLSNSVATDDNTALGHRSLEHNVTGMRNTGVGYSTARFNVRGGDNTAVGSSSFVASDNRLGVAHISDYSATVPGTVLVINFNMSECAHYLPVGTTDNIVITGTTSYDGTYTVTRVSASRFYFTHAYVADENTGLWYAGDDFTKNTAIGSQSGATITYGRENTFLGYNAGYNALQKVDAVNSTAVGAGTYTTKDNQVVIGDTNVVETVLRGRVLGNQGADIASANDMTLTVGNYFDITGSTEVQRILGTDWTAGTQVILQFDAAPLVKHGTAAGASYYGFQLAGAADFQASAGDTLMLVFDGAWWREVARTVI